MTTPGHSPHRRALSRWGTVHRWLGLALGLWFALVGLTGTLLVWRDEVDAWLNPQLFSAGPLPAAPLPIAAWVDGARAGLSLGPVERVRLPAQDGGPVRLQFRTAQGRVESARVEVFVDPASAKVLGQRALEGWSLAPPHAVRTIYEFHRNLLFGEPGSNFVGVAGLLLMTSAITGAVLAWPRSRERLRKLLSVSWHANGARVALDLHRSTGVIVVIVLLLATATGFTLVYVNVVRGLVDHVSRVEPIPVLPFRSVAAGQALLTIDELVERARAAHPDRQIREVRLSERGLTGMQFQLHAPGDVHRQGDTIVWLHPVTGEALAERSDRTRSGGETFMHWLLPLHVGTAFGSPGRAAMAIGGGAPTVLVVTGLVLWWRKRRAGH